MLEEFQQRLDEETAKCAEAEQRQKHASRTLVNVKAGIEHLADKLQHLKAVCVSSKYSKNTCITVTT